MMVAIGRLAILPTRSRRYEIKGQASQPAACARIGLMIPKSPVRAPVMIMNGRTGSASRVASGPTSETVPK